MSKQIGHFEILSELAKSQSGCVYKTNDPESGQTVALKTLRLDAFGEHAQELVRRILKEAESTKELDSSNITLVYGAGEIEGQLCATMDYIQGNSISTMLARKEGFSIWTCSTSATKSARASITHISTTFSTTVSSRPRSW